MDDDTEQQIATHAVVVHALTENKDRKQADTLVSVPQLQERGWTTMIRRLLGEPDASRPNPRYRSASPMRLYAPARVKAVEDTDDFKVAREAAAKRSAAGKARATWDYPL